MANYATLKKGSSGSDVVKLQEYLNNNGNYGLKTDGVFGSKTLDAVQDYQEQKGLTVDGIVGEETWGSLLGGSSSNTQAATQTATQPAAPMAESAKSYRYDAANDPVYQQALQRQEEVKANAPTYAGTFDQQVKDLFDQVMNQKDFSYDLNGDALWQQYKDQYTTQGKMAMMDTMGQAAALTGGYGSSYSQAAGQQAYQGHLQQLNDRVPELYQLAMDKYNNEQAMLKDKFGAAVQMQADEYGKYQDVLGQHNIDLDRAQSAVDAAYDRGHNAWATEEQLRRDDENTAYTKQQNEYDKLANLIASTGYTPGQAELAAAGMSATQAAAYGKAYNDAKKVAKSSGAKTTTNTEAKKGIDYKSMGYSDYNDMYDSFMEIYEQNGETALLSKLGQYEEMGYMSHDDALTIAAYIIPEDEGGSETGSVVNSEAIEQLKSLTQPWRNAK